MSGLPKRRRGRQSAAADAIYEAELAEFCSALLQINSRLDFKVASRGWCYVLEETIGLMKGDFDAGQRLINDLRKDGRLPLDICAEDQARCADHLEEIDRCSPAEEAQAIFSRSKTRTAITRHSASGTTSTATWRWPSRRLTLKASSARPVAPITCR